MNQITTTSAEVLKTRIASLVPALEEHRQELDRERRLPRQLFDAMAHAGLFRLSAPRCFGGWELTPLEFMEVVEAMAALDGALGWVVGNGGGMSRCGGYLPPAVAEQMFSCPFAFVVATNSAVGSAVPVEGGFRISGRWPFASGIHHATHVMAACQIPAQEGGAPSQVISCYLDAAHATIIDTWHASGLRGSGSCDYTLEDVFVPSEWTHPMLQPTPYQDGIVYRLPAVSAFAMTVSVVPLGIARGALDLFIRELSGRARAGTSACLRDRELIQFEIGKAETLHAAGRAALIGATHELTAAVGTGAAERLIRARAMYRASCTHAAEMALAICDILARAAGTSAILEAVRLERSIRDVQAAVRHVAMSPSNYVVAGRIVLGLDPGTGRF